MKTNLFVAKVFLLGLMVFRQDSPLANAQTYSSNVVGHVRLVLGVGFSFIANPFNGTNNNLNTVLSLPPAGIGTLIHRFDPGTGKFSEPVQFLGPGIGWVTGNSDSNALVFAPGEGFVIETTIPLDVSFVGDVPQGTLSNPIPDTFALRSSQVPQTLPLGSTGAAGTLQFPASDTDVVYIFQPNQTYKETYTFFDAFGWFSTNLDDEGTAGPTIPIARSFFVKVSGPAKAWNRTFAISGGGGPSLSITLLSNGDLEISWDGAGWALERASDVDDPFMTVPAATSPFIVPGPAPSPIFYRLRM